MLKFVEFGVPQDLIDDVEWFSGDLFRVFIALLQIFFCIIDEGRLLPDSQAPSFSLSVYLVKTLFKFIDGEDFRVSILGVLPIHLCLILMQEALFPVVYEFFIDFSFLS